MNKNFLVSLAIMSFLSLIVFAIGILLQEKGFHIIGNRAAVCGILLLFLSFIAHYKKIYV